MEMRNAAIALGMAAICLGAIAGCGARRQAMTRSRAVGAQQLLKMLENALEIYRLQIGHYPTADEGGLEALFKKPAFTNERLSQSWAGPYVERFPIKDPWGNNLMYKQTEEDGRAGFVVWSVGPDGKDGTEDDITSQPPER
jgi:general secretion pathway protein G